ncbi:MAG: Gldg family protein [Haloarculaceae archaeon]
MKASEILKPLGVFVVVIMVVLAGTAAVSLVTGSESPAPPDGQSIDGQSPPQFQPAAVSVDVDPETGNITFDGSGESKRILIDSQHGNRYDKADLEPVVEALTEAGHTVRFRADSSSSSGFGSSGYNATLQKFDAVMIIQPVDSFSEQQQAGLEAFAEGGGRILVLAEPTQYAGGGALSNPSSISFGATELTESFGVTVGSEMIYNVHDDANDNNFESIYAKPRGSGMLTEGVETVTFDSAGYVVLKGDTDAAVRYTAVEGSKTIDSRRTGTFPTVARNGNMVFVSDSSFIEQSEIYDVDNEVFIGNLLEFLVSGDKPDDVPQISSDGENGTGFGG